MLDKSVDKAWRNVLATSFGMHGLAHLLIPSTHRAIAPCRATWRTGKRGAPVNNHSVYAHRKNADADAGDCHARYGISTLAPRPGTLSLPTHPCG